MVAATAPRWQVMLAATIGATVSVGSIAAAIGGGLSEPFPTIRAYYLDGVLPAFVRCSTSLVLPISLLVSGVLLLAPSRTAIAPKEIGAFRALALVPVTTFIPVVAWSAMQSIAALSRPSMQINTGVPRWMTLDPIVIGGSLHWLPVLFVGAVITLLHAVRKLDRICAPPGAPVCVACGCDLAGIRPGRCPECGVEPAAP